MAEAEKTQRSPAGGRRRAPYRTYSEKLAQKIIVRLGQGEKWKQIAGTDGLPCYGTLYNWRKQHAEFAEQLDEALAMAADWNADRALEVAEAATKDSVQQDRLLVATLMKHAALTAPRRWGGKGKVAEPEQRVAVRVRDFVPFTRPDGRVVTREIFPDGTHQDYDR